MWTGARDERFTSLDLLERIISVIGPISIHPCGHLESPVQAEHIYYQEDDGLEQCWNGPDRLHQSTLQRDG